MAKKLKSWKEQFCKDCTFCVCELCYYGPPNIVASYRWRNTDYHSKVRQLDKSFEKIEGQACSKFEPKKRTK